ncbi:hypothetical protein HRbin34_00427 [bacterium HR34]|nr:hypothetical protein HRbin34_00427 [bacterium HR34]
MEQSRKIIQEEIKALKEKIQTLESQLEKAPSPEKEKKIKEGIKEFIRQTQLTPSYSPPITQTDEVEEVEALEDKSQQIGALIKLALEKGVVYATNIARQLKNPAILDEFHDTLVDRYYKILKEKGIIKD